MMNGVKEKMTVLYKFCIYINDICGFAKGYDEKGNLICPKGSGQLYLHEPEYSTQCPNKFLMTDKARGLYESRNAS